MTQEGLLAIPRSSAPRLRRPKRHETTKGSKAGRAAEADGACCSRSGQARWRAVRDPRSENIGRATEGASCLRYAALCNERIIGTSAVAASSLPRNASAPLRYTSWRIALLREREVTASTLTAGRLRLIRLVASPRHHQIHHHNIGLLSKSQSNTGLALLRFADHRYVVLQLKTQPDQPKEIRIVIYENHTDRHDRLPNCHCTAVRSSIGCAIRTVLLAVCFRGFAVGQAGVDAPVV